MKVVALRAVQSEDFMTADWCALIFDLPCVLWCETTLMRVDRVLL